MITIAQYFGTKINHPDATAERIANAGILLKKVNACVDYVVELGFARQIDPDTGTEISGSRHGAGDGGFRLSTATTGHAKSNHKEGYAVDQYDPINTLDDLLTDEILVKFGLYREHPDSTFGWCHLQDRPPKSGIITFLQ